MWLVESFLWVNEQLSLDSEIVVLSRNPAAFLRKMPHLAGRSAISFHAGEMDRFEFPSGPFGYVVHAATEAYRASPDFDRLGAFHRDVQGTSRMLEFARQCGAGRFLFTSSGAMYGRQPAEMSHVPEEFCGGPKPLDADSGYGQAKRASEFLCACYAQAHGLETTIARCFAFVGPYLPLNINFAIGNFLRDALAGGPICIQGDGTPRRSYLYAADLAVWLWTILLRGTPGRAYNVGSDVEWTIADLARKVAAEVAPDAEVRIAMAADSTKPIHRYVPSTRRAREELGLREWISLPEAIRRTAAWHRNQ
jgi:dTDP-glucose 4,6-dehydratase